MNEQAGSGDTQPWSEEQKEEYLRRHRLSAKRERVERVASNILHGRAIHGSSHVPGQDASDAFREAVALIDMVDKLT